jgi:hypothetical protein
LGLLMTRMALGAVGSSSKVWIAAPKLVEAETVGDDALGAYPLIAQRCNGRHRRMTSRSKCP